MSTLTNFKPPAELSNDAIPALAARLSARFPGLGLRAASAADDAFLHELYAATRDDLRLAAAPVSAEELIDMQRRAQDSAYRRIFPQALSCIVTQGHEPVGRILIDETRIDAGHDHSGAALPTSDLAALELIDICLLPHAHGRGTDWAIVSTLRQQAASRDQALVLSVKKNNRTARRLYLALGFQLCGADAVSEKMFAFPHQLALEP